MQALTWRPVFRSFGLLQGCYLQKACKGDIYPERHIMQHLEVEEACKKSMCGPQFIYVYTGRVVTHRLVTSL